MDWIGLDLSQTTTTPRAPLYRAVLKRTATMVFHLSCIEADMLWMDWVGLDGNLYVAGDFFERCSTCSSGL